MSSSKSERTVALVAVCAVASFVIAVAYSASTTPITGDPSPSATTMRTAIQGPQNVFPDCRDTTERPCVQWAEDSAWLVTETGARIPAIPVSRDESVRPRMITIR